MLATFLIMLREGLEAALIVGIIAAYLTKVGRRDALRPVALGVVAALALSVGLGLGIFVTVGRLPVAIKEPLEGLAGLLAVAVLTWMLFWMRRQGRALKGDLERQADLALSAGNTRSLVMLAFVAVLREGVETALFLMALFSSATAAGNDFLLGASVGAVLGLVAAVLIGWAFFRGALRLDLRRFFTITGVLIIFVAAGLVSFAVGEFTEAGWLPATRPVFDLAGVLPETSPVGALLAGLLGYRSQPTALEVVAYLAYLVPVLTLYLFGDRLRARFLAVAGAALLILGACGSSAPAVSIDPNAIQVTASEFKFTPSTLEVHAGAVAFAIHNAGTVEHEFEVLQGDRVVDEVEGLVPGLTLPLTVQLAPGTYQYVCRLPGHEQQGMTGTLTVTGP